MERKKGILVVSFGTSHTDTRKKTIEAIEEKIREEFSDYPVYRAWTSGMIIKKLKERDNLEIDTVPEAMERMKRDGITDVILQPTHIINGIETDIMKKEAHSFRREFDSIIFSTPLLTTEADSDTIIDIIAGENSTLKKEQALVLMGHGTSHHANAVYAALDYKFKDKGYGNVFVGTVEAYPSVEVVEKHLREYKPEEVILLPFMIVAGDHAKNDMAGRGKDSWMNFFRDKGYKVKPVLKGLGEYEKIQDVFIGHLKRTIEAAEIHVW